jgi:hypothetical protein
MSEQLCVACIPRLHVPSQRCIPHAFCPTQFVISEVQNLNQALNRLGTIHWCLIRNRVSRIFTLKSARNTETGFQCMRASIESDQRYYPEPTRVNSSPKNSSVSILECVQIHDAGIRPAKMVISAKLLNPLWLAPVHQMALALQFPLA